jgi:putative FmdB family regulatory protein
MPLYEYVCNDCDTRFEELRPARRMDASATCPSGHPSSRRVMSTFSAMTGSSYAEAEPTPSGGGCGGCAGGCSCGAN